MHKTPATQPVLPTLPILRLAQLREIEQSQRHAQPSLMERAGAAAAELALRLLAGAALPPLIVVGPGNNGGDALVVARRLQQQGLQPVVVFAGRVDQLPPAARAAQDAWIHAGGTLHAEIPAQAYGLAIDGLFGIGLGEQRRPLEGHYAALVAQLNALKTPSCPLLALDIPSGLDSETGCVLGSAVRATHTVTFIALKPGLLTLDGPDHCGAISVHDLDLEIDAAEGRSIGPALFSAQLTPRLNNSHKGSYGSAGIIGGAAGMAGAALLAGRAALKLGAGRVYVGLLDKLAVDTTQPELMLRAADEIFALADSLPVGPGWARPRPPSLLRRAIDGACRCCWMPTFLNLLAAHPVLARTARRTAPMLLTPHPAEAARLLGGDTEAVQADRSLPR